MSLCVVITLLKIFMYNERRRTSLLVWTVVRSRLQSAYILQSSEVVSSINPGEFVSVTLCVHAHVGVNGGAPSD